MNASAAADSPPSQAAATGARVARLCRYPVKGLNAQDLARVELAPGQGLPEDRRFALAHVGAPFDPSHPEWLPKSHFLMLMKNERLALLEAVYDDKTATLEIRRAGKRVARGVLTSPVGRAVIEDFFAAFMKGEALGKPRLVQAPGHMFSDSRAKVVSIVNLASVADLERIVGRPVDARRFRANIYVEGLAPWAEFEWIGRSLSIGGARLGVVQRIGRCPATDVDPATGMRDMNVPLALRRGHGHADMGVYAEVTAGGLVAAGDAIEIV